MKRKEIENILQPHLPLIRSCILDAFARYQRNLHENPDLRPAYGAREAATCINALVCQHARDRFEGVAGIQVSEVPGFLVLVFEQGFNVHFKKLGADRLARNNHTSQSKSIASQEPMRLFPELEAEQVRPADLWLIAGYQVDPTATQITDILITCPVSTTKNAWCFSIDDRAEEQEAVLVAPPAEPVISKPVLKRSKKSIA